MTEDILNRITHIQRRTPCEDGVRDWSNEAKEHQGLQATTRAGRGKEGFFPGDWEGAWLC